MNNNFELRIYPRQDENGETYWTATYPDFDGVVGGGATQEEAIQEAQENLEFMLEYLADTNQEIPQPNEEKKYNGKISLRVGKTKHEQLLEMSQKEGVSLNSYINSAIDTYIATYKLFHIQKLSAKKKA